jgi:hypothetical protein
MAERFKAAVLKRDSAVSASTTIQSKSSFQPGTCTVFDLTWFLQISPAFDGL